MGNPGGGGGGIDGGGGASASASAIGKISANSVNDLFGTIFIGCKSK